LVFLSPDYVCEREATIELRIVRSTNRNASEQLDERALPGHLHRQVAGLLASEDAGRVNAARRFIR
jgi:hypothetical protein